MTYTQQDSGFAARETLDGDHDGPFTAEAVVRRLIDEAFGQGHLEVCDELIADEIVEHQDYGPGHATGAAGVTSPRARTTARTWGIHRAVAPSEFTFSM